MVMYLLVSLAFLIPTTWVKAEEITDYAPSEQEETTYAPINYNGEFFSSITYQWSDANGNEQQSTLADEALTWPQMKQFIHTIMDDQRIPGMIADPTPEDLRPDNGYILRNGNYNIFTFPAGTEMKVDWTQKYNEWDLPALPNANDDRTDRTPYEDGLTAVLVKLRDNFSSNSNRRENSSVESLVTDNIESMQVMTNRLRVEGNNNPGWLFNIRTPLNKFFVMTKGKLRNTVSAPFSWMFEQYSPAEDNNLPENVYNQMLGNETFPILHDCRGTITKYHPTLMGSKSNTKDYVSSIIVYIPDKRFSKLTEEQCTNQDEDGRWFRYNTQNSSKPKRYAGEDWTRDAGTSFIYYNPEFTPVMMFNTVELFAKDVLLTADNSNVPEGYAWVKLQWQSNVSRFLEGTDNVEKFQLFRIENGRKVALTEDASADTAADDEELPAAIRELVAENPELDTVRTEDGEIYLYHVSRTTGWVTAYVLEAQQQQAHQITYLVEGTIDGSEVSDVESNTVEVTIPGFTLLERCELNIVSKPTSQFVYRNDAEGNDADYNHYVHRLGLANGLGSTRYPMLAGHVKNISGDSAQDTYFTLCRTNSRDAIIIDVDTADETAVDQLLSDNNILALQRLYITGYEENAEDGYTYFSGKLVDLTTGQTLVEKDAFKALTAEGDAAVLIGLGKDDDVWFTVTFDEPTKDNLHPMKYCYRLFSNIQVQKEENSDEMGYACSTIINIDIPHTKIDTTFRGYTMDEILEDYGRTLNVSGKQVVYRAIDDVNVASYTMLHNGGSRIAEVRRTQDGVYSLALYSSEEVAMPGLSSGNSSKLETIDFGEQRFDIVKSVSEMGGDIVCRITDFAGNTYGSGRALVPKDIALDGSIQSLEGYKKKSFYMVANGQVGDTEDNQRYLVANSLFNAWTMSEDGSQTDEYADELWDNQSDMTQIISVNNLVAGVAAADEEYEPAYQIDGNDLTFSHTYDYPDWVVGMNSDRGERPFVANVMLRYYPEIIPVESYDPYQVDEAEANEVDETNETNETSEASGAASEMKRKAGCKAAEEAPTLYAVAEIPMTYLTYGDTVISSIDSPNSPDANPIQTVLIYSIQGILLARYRAKGDDREILQASGLPVGNYVACIGDRTIKAAIR
jgi:hypothetical protein